MDERTLSAEASQEPVISRKTRQISVVFRQSGYEGGLKKEFPVSASAAKQADKAEADDQYEQIMQQFEPLVGMDQVKQLVYGIYALLRVNRMREHAGLARNQQMYHMVFKGNPGTGKTTVARIVANMFKTMGVLSKGHLIEVERADLVGEYIGHTALKTRELVKKAMDGILFVDEAYSLARGGEKDFGKEAIDALVKAMEDHKDRFVLILAGYSDEMDQFLRTNPGLPSRFPLHIDFPDYSVDELIRIAEKMVDENEYTILPQTMMKLKHHLIEIKQASGETFSNARYVRNMIEKSIRNQAVRLLQEGVKQPGRHELMSLRPEDFRF